MKKQKLKEYNIAVGEIGISYVFDQSLFHNKIKYYKNEFVADNRTEIKLNIHHGNILGNSEKKKIFDSKTHWSLYCHDGKYILQNCSFDSSAPPQKLIILKPDFKSGDIYFSSGEFYQTSPFDLLKHTLIQILMIILLSTGKGVMVHACGIEDKGYGYLFLGNSGHGKSTVARLWFENQATVLNDDRIIIRLKDEELWMYGTPWHGDFEEVSSKGLPIRKIFFLGRGERNSAVPKNAIEAVSMLLSRCFLPIWDKKGMEFTLKFCAELAQKVPCYELRFVPDESVLDFVRDI